MHYPVNSRRLPETSVRAKQASCRYSWKTMFSRLLPQISVENRSPYPVLKYSLVTCSRWSFACTSRLCASRVMAHMTLCAIMLISTNSKLTIMPNSTAKISSCTSIMYMTISIIRIRVMAHMTLRRAGSQQEARTQLYYNVIE